MDTFKSFKKSQELLKATWECDADRVAQLLEWFHDSAENKTYNSEAALSYAVQTAADQIRDRKYPQKLEHYEGNLLLVSVNYDKELAVGDENYKRHSCRIEKY